MKGFLMDSSGDIVIENRQIQYTRDVDLLRQTAERVLNTNKREWFLNLNEGIDFHAFLGKNPNRDYMKYQLFMGLRQVDKSFVIEEIEFLVNGRHLEISFTATANSGTISTTIRMEGG